MSTDVRSVQGDYSVRFDEATIDGFLEDLGDRAGATAIVFRYAELCDYTWNDPGYDPQGKGFLPEQVRSKRIAGGTHMSANQIGQAMENLDTGLYEDSDLKGNYTGSTGWRMKLIMDSYPGPAELRRRIEDDDRNDADSVEDYLMDDEEVVKRLEAEPEDDYELMSTTPWWMKGNLLDSAPEP